MKILINVILVPLAIILLCAFIFAGFKALFRNMKVKIDNFFHRKPEQADGEKQADPRAMMDIATIKAGTCQSCGRTYIGTSDDKDCPLKVVKFMGVTRTLCTDCLNRVFADFTSTAENPSTHYSESAQKLKQILDKSGK